MGCCDFIICVGDDAGGGGQIDLSFHSFVCCDDTNKMHKLKVTDEWSLRYICQSDKVRKKRKKKRNKN